MDRKIRIAALVTFAVFVGDLLRSPEPDLTGHYEMILDWTSSTGTDEPGPDGRDYIQVNVDRRANAFFIYFEVSRVAPYQRVLDARADANQQGGSLHFDFEDSWGNLCRGRFFQRGDKYVLKLECLGGGSQDVRTLYEEWEVMRKSG